MSDLVRSKSKRIIIWSVIGAHIVLIVIPGIVYALKEWMKPKKTVIHKVVVTDQMPGSDQNPDADPGGTPENTQQQETLPPDPQKISDIPDMPQPKPQPKPVIKPKPQPKPVVKPTPKPKPVVKPKPQPVVKPKPKPQPKRPSVEDIRSKIQRAPQKTVSRQPRQINIQRNPGKQQNHWNNLARNVRAGNNTRSGGNSISTGAASNYYATVGGFLEREWKKDRPNSSAIRNRRPLVVVRLRVDQHGAIISKQIIQRSGIAVVDASVVRLLNRIRIVPAPPPGITEFSVNMRIED